MSRKLDSLQSHIIPEILRASHLEETHLIQLNELSKNCKSSKFNIFERKRGEEDETEHMFF